MFRQVIIHRSNFTIGLALCYILEFMHSSITRQSASKMLLKSPVFQPKFNDTTEKKLTPGTINSILKEASMKIWTK
jgi:hypothetical protein